MKFNSFRFVLISSFIVFLTSCLGTTDTTVVSSDTSFVSLTLAKNDSVKSAVFTLVGDTIVNLDSLPFNTKVDAVYPTFSFKSTAAIHVIFHVGSKKDSVSITGKDTIDFTQVVGVRNYASDTKASKLYYVKVNIHRVQPELYVWNKVSESVDSHDATSQKAIVFNDTIFYYLNNGSAAYLYKSTDGKSWEEQSVSGLPVNTSLTDMQLFNGKLYLTQDGDKVYSSSDRRKWTAMSEADCNFMSLLFVFQNKLWAVVKSKANSKYYFKTYDGNSQEKWSDFSSNEIPANFPVRDFASLSFASRTGKPKVLLVGGYSADNNELKTRWSSENGVYWVDFSVENKTLDSLMIGSSVISYDKHLLLFGKGINKKGNVVDYLRKSIDEGLTWQTPDTLYNRLRQVVITKVSDTKNDTAVIKYQPRNYESVVVYKPRTYSSTDSKLQNLESNRIFIIGGQSGSTSLSDVWTGKLNRKNFLRQ